MEETRTPDLIDEEMNIHLKITKTLSVRVKKSEGVASLKALVHEREGIPEINQELLFYGAELDDRRRLVDYGVENNSTLHLFVQNFIGFDLLIKFPTNGRSVLVRARPGDFLHSIKEQIQKKENIDSDAFALVWNGMLLEEDKTLASVGIGTNSILNLVYCPKDVLSVSIETPSGSTLKLKVKALFTVRDVKAILGGIVDYRGDNQRLFYRGQVLEDRRTLAFYDIIDESVLQLAPLVPVIVLSKIFVRNFEGKSVMFQVCASETVEDLKLKIHERLKVPVVRQFIVFEGKRLEDERTLQSYGVQNNSTLALRPRAQ